MGTNYYARIIPSEEKKQALKAAIDSNDFNSITNLVGLMYSGYHDSYEDGGMVGGEIHLGKRSGGWKFLWNPNLYEKRRGHLDKTTNTWVEDPSECQKVYDLTKKSIKAFLDREDVEVWNEYGEQIDKEEFWKMTQDWDKELGAWDGDLYVEWERTKGNNPGYHPMVFEDEYIKFLRKQGYIINKYLTDFYSDGLRFATCTEFS